MTIPEAPSNVLTSANLTSLRGALVGANLVETANTTPDLTIFAPTNQAFQDIGSVLANASIADITKILSYHVVAGPVGYSTKLRNGTSLTTLNGANVTVFVDNDGIYVNNAQVVFADVLVSNGVVHVISEVLNPNNASAPEGEPAFGGATPASNAPFTSGQPQPSSPIGGGPGGAAGSSPSPSGGPQATRNAAAAKPTGAVGLGALLGGAAAMYFL